MGVFQEKAEALADAIQRNDDEAAKQAFVGMIVTTGMLVERAVVALERIADSVGDVVVTGQ